MVTTERPNNSGGNRIFPRNKTDERKGEMNNSTRQATIIAILLALLLTTACQLLGTDEPATVDPDTAGEPIRTSTRATHTPRPDVTSEPTPISTPTPESPFGGHSILSRLTPTPTPEPTTIPATPSPIPSTEIDRQIALRYTEGLERCYFWAHREIESPTWVEFRELNPDNMTDLQRELWESVLWRNNYNCWPYFAERLSEDNAHKRNWRFQAECLTKMNGRKNQFYETAGRAIQHEYGHPNTINQYARIMNFLELTGPELMAMEVKPYELYLKLLYGRNPNPAHFSLWVVERENTYSGRYYTLWVEQTDIRVEQRGNPYEDGDTLIPADWVLVGEGYGAKDHTPLVGNLPNSGDSEPLTIEQVEWYGFGNAFDSVIPCKRYFPQMFTGYWVPYAGGGYSIQPGSQVPELEGERDLLIPDHYRRDN